MMSDSENSELDITSLTEAIYMRAMKILNDFDVKIQHRHEKEAKELGFSSWLEYDHHLKEQWQQRDERYEIRQNEECARLGITLEQLEAMDPQRDTSAGWEPDCDCDSHPIHFFCPKALVDYHSQELLPFLEDRHRLQIDDLKIEPGEKSKRHHQGTLEYLWGLKSRDNFGQLPFWAKGDSLLQQIISTRPPSPATLVDSTSYRSYSSSLTDFNMENDMNMNDLKSDTAINMMEVNSKCDSCPQTTEKIIFTRPLSPATLVDSTSYRAYSSSLTDFNMENDTNMNDLKSDTAIDMMEVNSKCDNCPQTIEKQENGEAAPVEGISRNPQSVAREQLSTSSIIINKRSKRRSRNPPGQRKKSKTSTRIQKITPSPARSTRSRRPTKFYELDLNGIVNTVLSG